jgi:hypothetical protein
VSGWTLTDLGAPGDGRVLEFLPETYTLNADGVDAVWTNTGTLGSAGNATQSTHANKPTASGAALAFDGSDDELDISGATLTGATAVTVVCRANLKTLGKNMFLESLTGGSPYHQHYMDAANDLNIYTTGALTRTPSISAGTQFTVAFVTNGAASSIWQDGTRVGEEGSAGALTIPSGYRIGYRSTYEFDGDLYGLRVYSRALTAAELASTSLWQWTH